MFKMYPSKTSCSYLLYKSLYDKFNPQGIITETIGNTVGMTLEPFTVAITESQFPNIYLIIHAWLSTKTLQ